MNTIAQQIFNGLVNGSTYALLALGLVIIYGILRIINFAHGSFYMLGAYGAFLLTSFFDWPFWLALAVVPISVALIGVIAEKYILRRVEALDPVYTLLATYALMLLIQGAVQHFYGTGAQPIAQPVSGMLNLGLFKYPAYQTIVFVASIVLTLITWATLRFGKLGLTVRAATERRALTGAFGVNVLRWTTPVFGFGIFVAGVAGVLTAPLTAISPDMGVNVIVAVFAVVVVGGVDSVFGSVVVGYALGVIQAMFDLYVPALSNFTLFLVMAIVLLIKPSGLFGHEAQ